MKTNVLTNQNLKRIAILFILNLLINPFLSSQNQIVEQKVKQAAQNIENFLKENGPMPVSQREKFEYAMLLFEGVTVEKDIGRLPAKSVMPIIEELLAKDPDNSNLNFYMGLCCYYSIEKIAEAIPYFKKACKNTTVSYVNNYGQKKAPAWAYFFLAKSYEKTGNYSEAIANYNIFKGFLLPQHYRYKMMVEQSVASCNKKKNEIIKKINFQENQKNSEYELVSNVAPYKNLSPAHTDYAETISDQPEDLKSLYHKRIMTMANSKEGLTLKIFEGFPDIKENFISRFKNSKKGEFVFDKEKDKIWIIEK